MSSNDPIESAVKGVTEGILNWATSQIKDIPHDPNHKIIKEI